MDKQFTLFHQYSLYDSPKNDKTTCEYKPKLSKKLTIASIETFHDHYTIEQKLGVGGFGTVYAGTQSSDQQPIAIKMLKRKKIRLYTTCKNESLPLEVILLDCLREVSNVCRLLHAFKDDAKGVFVIVMERPAHCIDLYDFIAERVMLSERLTADIMRQLLKTLVDCHKAGVYHRDIKDENILIDLDTMTIKLIDFGSGAFVQEEEYRDDEGTRVYCPPEWLIQGRYHGLALTVWSLGILLYNMLCGDVPFKHSNEIIKAEVNFPQHISSEAQDLIRLSLSVEPSVRPSLEDIERHVWFKRSAYPDTIPLSIPK